MLFIAFVVIGLYFTYVRPKMSVFNQFKNDPNFANYILIIESNAEFDQRSYSKAMKHIKLFLMYYSQSFDTEYNVLQKMEEQHDKVIKYLNRMLFSIPNSMRRYMYMQNAITNLDGLFKAYIQKSVNKISLKERNI